MTTIESQEQVKETVKKPSEIPDGYFWVTYNFDWDTRWPQKVWPIEIPKGKLADLGIQPGQDIWMTLSVQGGKIMKIEFTPGWSVPIEIQAVVDKYSNSDVSTLRFLRADMKTAISNTSNYWEEEYA